jgi:YkoY family integral membrane protein
MDGLLSGSLVVLTIVFMEALLSVDNVLVIAAMTQRLPEAQQKKALWYGMVGAYVLRILALLLASVLLEWAFIRVFGALYLVYLMSVHLTAAPHGGPKEKKDLFWPVVAQILLADLAFAIDNVAAAVALSRQLWAILLGVSLGIVTMVLLANHARALMKRFPVLEPAAYAIVGFVGLLLLFEEVTHLHLGEMWKVGGVAGMLAASLLYPRFPLLQKLLSPFFWVAKYLMRAFVFIFEVPVTIVRYTVRQE